MKKFLVILSVILFSTTAYAGSVSLQWDANAVSDKVVAYNVYMDGKKNLSVTGTTATVKDVINGAHSFYVTAVNEWAESSPSNIVMVPPLPSTPANVKITIVITVN